MIIPSRYAETIPKPSDSRNVEAFWSYVADKDGTSTILPDGRCDIIVKFNIKDKEAPRPVITGPATKPYLINYLQGDAWIGLRMRPCNGAGIWGGQIAQSRDQVLRGPAAEKMVPALSQASKLKPDPSELGDYLRDISKLLERDGMDETLIRVIERIHSSGGRLSVRELSHLTGWSVRHLHRRFVSNVGLSIKMYSQLVQFHRALNLIQSGQLSFADTSFEAGYSDQAHFSRVVKRFSGFKPSMLPSDLSLPALFTVSSY